MVNVSWTTKVEGKIDSNSGFVSEYSSSLNFEETVYSKSVVYNDEGTPQNVSFKNKDGNEVFTINSIPPNQDTHIFWKTNKFGTPLWGFKICPPSRPFNNSWTFLDNDGNYYISIDSNNTVVPDGPISFYNSTGSLAQTINLDPGFSYQSLLAKYDTEGIFQWVIKFSSTIPTFVRNLKFDTDGSFYVTGDFRGSVTVTDTSSSFSITSIGSSLEQFVIKFTIAGVKIWNAKLTGSGLDILRDLDITNLTNIYLTLDYRSNPLILTPGIGSVVNFVGSTSIRQGLTLALSKATGSYVWAVLFGSPGNMNPAVSQSDSSGVYCIGKISGDYISVKNGAGANLATILWDSVENTSGVFICKISHAGAYLWHVTIDGTSNEDLTEISAGTTFRGRIIDSVGNVYFKGKYSANSITSTAPNVYDKDGNVIGTLTDTDLDSTNSFIVKINPDGSFGWITKIKPTTTKSFQVFQMFVGVDDNLYLTANAQDGYIRFYDEGNETPAMTITTNTTTWLINPFIFSYDSSGNYRWAVHALYPGFDLLSSISEKLAKKIEKYQNLNYIIMNRLAVTPEGRIYVTFDGPSYSDVEIYVDNTKDRTLTFNFNAPETSFYQPYVLALADSTVPPEPPGPTPDNNWLSVIIVVLFAALLVLAITLLN